MTSSGMTGLVQTVLGPVAPGALGPTTTHEHLLIDFSFMYKAPENAADVARGEEPISLENLGWVRHNHYSSRANLEVLDEDNAINEVKLYKSAGGGTIVDATTVGIGRNPKALERISKEADVNVIMGAGFYVDAVHAADMANRSEGDLARQIVEEITFGVDGTGIKAGVIGEIGCSWPLTDNERKVLRAVAAAQQETGAAILIHPGRNQGAPAEIIGTLTDAGANISRTIMGHLDRTIFNFDVLRGLASTGCYLEWDLFGNESSFYPLADIDMPSDAQRLDFIKKLVDEGYGPNIVLGQDICTNHRLAKYGGHGYGHILNNIVPKMRVKGFTEEAIHDLVVANPARILAFA